MFNIGIKELLKKSNINIIDIRSIEKYNDNHISNAKNIPMILLLKNPSKYLSKNETYYIYCQKGVNSLKVCSILRKQGFNAININGGYENWLLQN